MKVGSLVKAHFWGKEYIAIVVSIINPRICAVTLVDGTLIYQNISGLELINADR